MTAKKILLLLFTCLMICISMYAQDSSRLDRLVTFPDKLFQKIDNKVSSIQQKLDKQTNRYLLKLQRQENQLRKKLWKKDSTLAKQLFNGVNEKYKQLQKDTSHISKYRQAYSGHLDSLSTALSFLKDQNLVKGAGLDKSLGGLKEIQNRFNQSNQINNYLIQRQQLLKQQFGRLGMVKELKKFRQGVYYYQQQIKEYKNLFEHPGKLEARLMQLMLGQPLFKDFFAKNSVLGSLFGLPTSNSMASISFQGLQTRAMVTQTLNRRFTSAASMNAQMQQSVQQALPSFDGLKSKLKSVRSGNFENGGNEADQGFKPNTQKTKSFLQRLEYGANVQSQKARYWFPVTSDVALSVGYRINDRSTLGLGGAYRMGWGSNWRNISITHQGVGIRSFIDWNIKNSFYISGGYEKNYQSIIHSIDQLRNESAWQTAGLVGLSKKYCIGKKLKGDIKLLWDFLSYQQKPRTQAIVFRAGYSFK